MKTKKNKFIEREKSAEKNELTGKKIITAKTELRQEIKKKYIKPAVKTSLTPEQFKFYVTQVYLFDELKTKIFNGWRSSISNNIIKYDELYPEICRLRRIENKTKNEEKKKGIENKTENKKDGIKNKIANLVKEALIRQLNLTFEKNGDETRVTMIDVEDYVYYLAKQSADIDMPTQFLDVVIADRVKDVEKYMEENLPVYQWCKEVRGLGTKLAAKLLAGIGDIQRFPMPSSLWSYCGVGDAEKSKRQTGKQLSHSPKMRACLFNIEESFIKANSQYRVTYDKRKEETLTKHPEWHNLIPCPVKNVDKNAPKTDENGNVTWNNMHPKHAHIDASRVMIKRFLAELYVAWYESLGIEPPAKAYGIEIEGHHEEPMIIPYVKVEVEYI